MSKVALGALTIRQSELKADWTPPRTYDLVLTAASWEDRSLTALELITGHIDEIQVLYFRSRAEAVDQEKQAKLATVKGLFPKTNVIDLSYSTDVQENFARLEATIKDKYMARGAPLRVLIDISSLPKTYILFLVGMGFTRDYFACLDCLYVGGAYDLASEDRTIEDKATGARALVSEGDWRSDLVPYLTASSFLPGSRDLLVALGGEIGLSAPFIERVEPPRLNLIFIEETAPGPEREMLDTERAALDALMDAPNATRNDFALGDVIGLASHAIRFCRSAAEAGVSGMAIGSKPHALALGIAALSEPSMEVICRTPAAYKALNVKPSGLMYFYEIEDRFEPCSYIDC